MECERLATGFPECEGHDLNDMPKFALSKKKNLKNELQKEIKNKK